jgi:hypothetical protein
VQFGEEEVFDEADLVLKILLGDWFQLWQWWEYVSRWSLCDGSWLVIVEPRMEQMQRH